MEYQSVKEVPYGVSDFVTIVEQNIYYVDKTMYIPELEKQARNLFFIRPRRFGKSLFLGMLHAYYDCRTKDKFEQWFGNLWIGRHRTPTQGRYQVLHLDFSQVGGTIEKLEENFNFYLGLELDGFVNAYSKYYSEETIRKVKATDYAGGKLGIIQQEARIKNYPLYLIIDEYDNFTNTNNNVRKQYYGFLLDEYQKVNHVNLNDWAVLFTYMAFDGKWQDALGHMAEFYAKVSSVRDGIEAERNLQGFFMAYLNLNAYYYTAPELELNHGYCDFFLLPDLTRYPTRHSYILELKLVPKKEKGEKAAAYAERVEKQWQEAVTQIDGYAKAPRVEALCQGTQLHKIIMQLDGWKLRRMEEV